MNQNLNFYRIRTITLAYTSLTMGLVIPWAALGMNSPSGSGSENTPGFMLPSFSELENSITQYHFFQYPTSNVNPQYPRQTLPSIHGMLNSPYTVKDSSNTTSSNTRMFTGNTPNLDLSQRTPISATGQSGIEFTSSSDANRRSKIVKLSVEDYLLIEDIFINKASYNELFNKKQHPKIQKMTDSELKTWYENKEKSIVNKLPKEHLIYLTMLELHRLTKVPYAFYRGRQGTLAVNPERFENSEKHVAPFPRDIHTLKGIVDWYRTHKERISSYNKYLEDKANSQCHTWTSENPIINVSDFNLREPY